MSSLRCQAKRGIMTLRLCDEPALVTCTQCQRPTCLDHLTDPASTVCRECHARSPARSVQGAPDPFRYDDPSWPIHYTLWLGSSGDRRDLPSFDPQDARSFQNRRDDDPVEKPAAGGGFLDS